MESEILVVSSEGAIVLENKTCQNDHSGGIYNRQCPWLGTGSYGESYHVVNV